MRRLLAALLGAWLGTAAVPGAQSSSVREEVESALKNMKFTPAEIASLQQGTVIARAESAGNGEMITQAAVRLRVPHDQVVSYYGQMIAYVDGKVTLGFGRFSTPAVAADVAKLAFDRDEVDALKNCKPGNCDIRLSGAGMTALQSAVDWKAADYVERANAFARKTAIDYITAYRARGDAALVTFNDTGKPVNLGAEWKAIVGNSPLLQTLRPEIVRYLTGYPKETLANSRDIIYWIKEDYGMKPVTSLVHALIDTSGAPGRTIVAQKYIYASHYYDASFAIASIMTGSENGSPVTYIVYGNRSRGDVLRGGFGGLTRNVVRNQAKKAAQDTLGTIKQVLEKP